MRVVVRFTCPHHPTTGEVGSLWVEDDGTTSLYGSPEKMLGPGYAHETFACSEQGCQYAPEVGPDGRERLDALGRRLAEQGQAGILTVDLDRVLRVSL